MAKSTTSSMEGNTSVAEVEGMEDRSTSAKLARMSQRKRSTHQVLSKAVKKLSPLTGKLPIFPRFNDLPEEIRKKIWLATIEPKVHELHPCANLYNNRMTFRSNSSSTPVIFHVCRESREEALRHHLLMQYTPGGPGKGILRFYFAPKLDTLFLNSLMGLFVMFMLLEHDEDHIRNEHILNTGGPTQGVMKGWERVALDVERAQLITLLSTGGSRSRTPRFKELFPDLKELIIAFDCTRKGKTRFRTSVWPGENGTSLQLLRIPGSIEGDVETMLDTCIRPLERQLNSNYKTVPKILEKVDPDAGEMEKYCQQRIIETRTEEQLEEEKRDTDRFIPEIKMAKVNRKLYLRGDLRYALRWGCSILGVRPRGILRRL